MNIEIKELTEEFFLLTVKMITELMNYHRKLTNAALQNLLKPNQM